DAIPIAQGYIRIPKSSDSSICNRRIQFRCKRVDYIGKHRSGGLYAKSIPWGALIHQVCKRYLIISEDTVRIQKQDRAENTNKHNPIFLQKFLSFFIFHSFYSTQSYALKSCPPVFPHFPFPQN